MIITRLIGGLGNQMFQYAIGRCLSYKLGKVLKLDITGYENINEGTIRKYELDKFNINADIATSQEIFSLKSNLYKEKAFYFDENFVNLNTDTYLVGYWQTEKYFGSIKKLILKEFSIKISELDLKNKQMLNLVASKQSVSLHIRRGDYVTNQVTSEFHGVQPLDYYYKAIEIISNREKNPHFFLFSDDIGWAKENFKINFPVNFVDFNNNENSHFDMFLMSKCKHNIIANSSFSWWGAWLNQNSDKIIIAPQKWFNTNIDTKDLIPENWIRL